MLVGRLRAGAQEDDRDLTGVLARAQLLGDAPAVHRRQHDVEQDEVRPLRAGKSECLLAVRRLEGVEPGAAQIDPANEPDCLLVVDDEHAPLGSAASAAAFIAVPDCLLGGGGL